MLEKGDLITLSNNVQYIVMKQILYKGNSYVYLVKKDNLKSVAVCKLLEDKVILVTEEKLLFKLLELFADEMEEAK